VSTTNETPTPGGSIAGGAPSSSKTQDAAEDHGLQDPLAEASHGNGTPVQEAVPEMDSITMVGATVSLAMCEVAVSGPTGLTGLTASAPSSPPQMAAATTSVGADDDTIEEPEVILGHPILRAPGDVSLSEAMGTTHWALN
jgi:hypothetical protein